MVLSLTPASPLLPTVCCQVKSHLPLQHFENIVLPFCSLKENSGSCSGHLPQHLFHLPLPSLGPFISDLNFSSQVHCKCYSSKVTKRVSCGVGGFEDPERSKEIQSLTEGLRKVAAGSIWTWVKVNVNLLVSLQERRAILIFFKGC